MNRAVKLSEMLLTNAGKYANIFSRSIPKQIEHWFLSLPTKTFIET